MLTPFNNAQGGKIAINGFDDEARRLFGITINEGVHIDAFVSEEREFHGLRFYNKPIVAMNELGDDWTLLTPWRHRDCAPTGRRACYLPTERELSDGGGVVIYGTAVLGKEAFEQCAKLNINVAAFCDSDKSKRGGTFNGKPILSPDDLAERYDTNTVIVIASQFRVEIEETLCQRGFTHVWHYLLENNLFLCYDTIYEARSKKIILWGSTAYDLELVAKRRAMLDVHIAYGVVSRNPGDTRQDDYNTTLQIRRKDALLGEDYSKSKVLFTHGCTSEIVKFVRQHKSSNMVCARLTSSIIRAGRQLLLDPLLGAIVVNDFDESVGTQILRTRGSHSPVKVAFLGDCSTHIKQSTVKSIPEFMLDIAEREHLGMEIIGGGAAGHKSSQSLLRLMRDIIPLQPDIVVSFNIPLADRAVTIPENCFLHQFQKQNVEQLSELLHQDVYYGTTPEHKWTFHEYWINMHRMMAAICHEFGIKFYAFIQACTCSMLTAEDLEHLMATRGLIWGEEKHLPTLPTLGDKSFVEPLIEASKHYDWLYDASGLVEHEPDTHLPRVPDHLNEKGFAITAQFIYDTIFKDWGRSKKAAEQAAAKVALDHIK